MSNSNELSVQGIIEKFKSSDATERKKFIKKKLPLTKWREEAEMAAQMNSPEMRANALDFAAMACLDNGDFKKAAKFGEAGYRLAVEGYESGTGDKSVYRQIAGRNALNWMNALQRLGQHNQIIELLKQHNQRDDSIDNDKPIAWLNSIGDRDTLGMLLLKEVEAQLDLENYDEANKLLKKIDKMLDEKTLSLSYFERISYRSHQYRIEQHQPDVTKLSEEVAVSSPKDLKKIFSGQEFKEDDVPSLKDLTKVLSGKESKKVDDETWQGYLQSKQIYEQYKDVSEEIVTKLFGRSDNEFTVRQEILKANYLFMDPQKGRDPKEIETIIPVLEDGRNWMKKHNLPDSENDALWGLYLCYSRTERELQAIEVLQALRANLEKMREKISDPMKRAAINSRYPYLFASLCQLLCRSNQTAELLDAMEGAKGRVLADVLTEKQTKNTTEKQAKITSDREFSEPAKQLPALMQQVNAHYLSYFVDDEATYAVLVAKDGSLHSHEISIGKQQIQEWLNLANTRKDLDTLRPLDWGKSIIRGKKVVNLSEKLTPLVSWLEELADQGIIQENDHICYCPDEELHLIPLHYLLFNGKYLINFVSVSRIQGALALVNILKQEAFKPTQSIAVQVWTQKDENPDNKDSDTMLSAFRKVREWLKANLSGEVLMGASVDLPTVVNQEFTQKISHFNTHGVFPSLQEQEESKKNPYLNSGLLLAENGQLPPNAESPEKAGLLSPEKVYPKENDQPKLNCDRSHVTLQACVSGRAKEGIGGDALGLEWAFLLSGASSLLASHWNVDADWAAKFSIEFYQKWLFENVSRAVAWRDTVLDLFSECESQEQELKRKHPELDREHPERRAYYWAAFSLSGDWR